MQETLIECSSTHFSGMSCMHATRHMNAFHYSYSGKQASQRCLALLLVAATTVRIAAAAVRR